MKIYLAVIGEPFDEKYRIAGYTRTKKAAVNFLHEKGYPKLNKRYGYYENEYDGAWARIFEIEELASPEAK